MRLTSGVVDCVDPLSLTCGIEVDDGDGRIQVRQLFANSPVGLMNETIQSLRGEQDAAALQHAQYFGTAGVLRAAAGDRLSRLQGQSSEGREIGLSSSQSGEGSRNGPGNAFGKGR